MIVDIKHSKAGQDALQQVQVAVKAVSQAAKTVGDTKVYKQVSYVAKGFSFTFLHLFISYLLFQRLIALQMFDYIPDQVIISPKIVNSICYKQT